MSSKIPSTGTKWLRDFCVALGGHSHYDFLMPWRVYKHKKTTLGTPKSDTFFAGPFSTLASGQNLTVKIPKPRNICSVLSIKGPNSLLLGLYNFIMCYVTLHSKLNHRKVIFCQIIGLLGSKFREKCSKNVGTLVKNGQCNYSDALRHHVCSVFCVAQSLF